LDFSLLLHPSKSKSQSGSEDTEVSSLITWNVECNASYCTDCQAFILWYLDKNHGTKVYWWLTGRPFHVVRSVLRAVVLWPFFLQ
jgi:hypothetical protein